MAVLGVAIHGRYLYGMQKITFILIMSFGLLLSATMRSQAQASPKLSEYSWSNGPEKDKAWFCNLCYNNCDTLAFAVSGKCPHCGMDLVSSTYGQRRAAIKNYLNTMTICFYLQDGVEVLDFAGPMEVFTYAGFKVFTVSKTKDPIIAQGVLKVVPDYSIADAPPSDILAFFGGNAGNAYKDTAVISWVQSRRSSTTYFFSVCTGAFIMAQAGILNGLTATTFHSSIESLQKSFPGTKVLSDKRFVDNGKVITTAGISAGIDGALHLVAKLKGDEVATEAAKYMEYDKWVPKQGLVVTK